MKIPEPDAPRTISVTSPEFGEGEGIPARFTCAGLGNSPAFAWSGAPAEAASLAVVVSDPDAPGGAFLHWLVTSLPARDGAFGEGKAAAGGRELPNSARTRGWYPPCPPSGTHRYVFAVHALDAAVTAQASREALAEIGAHTIAWGTLTGLVAVTGA